MDFNLSRDTLVSIVAIIAPGYFAIQVYAAINAKPRKEFSRLLLESVVYGLVIVSFYNAMWRLFSSDDTIDALSIYYYLPLLLLSPLLGAGVSFLRHWAPVNRLGARFDIPDADDDFIRLQFAKLPPSAFITVTLRSGQIFSGTLMSLSPKTDEGDQRLVFDNVAWYSKRRRVKHWDFRPGSLIIALSDVLYIETGAPLTDPA